MYWKASFASSSLRVEQFGCGSGSILGVFSKIGSLLSSSSAGISDTSVVPDDVVAAKGIEGTYGMLANDSNLYALCYDGGVRRITLTDDVFGSWELMSSEKLIVGDREESQIECRGGGRLALLNDTLAVLGDGPSGEGILYLFDTNSLEQPPPRQKFVQGHSLHSDPIRETFYVIDTDSNVEEVDPASLAVSYITDVRTQLKFAMDSSPNSTELSSTPVPAPSPLNAVSAAGGGHGSLTDAVDRLCKQKQTKLNPDAIPQVFRDLQLRQTTSEDWSHRKSRIMQTVDAHWNVIAVGINGGYTRNDVGHVQIISLQPPSPTVQNVLKQVSSLPPSVSVTSTLITHAQTLGLSLTTSTNTDISSLLDSSTSPEAFVNAHASSNDHKLTTDYISSLARCSLSTASLSTLAHHLAFSNLTNSIYRLAVVSAANHLGASNITFSTITSLARHATQWWGICKTWKCSEVGIKHTADGFSRPLKLYISARDTSSWINIRMADEDVTREIHEGRIKLGLGGWEEWGAWPHRLSLSPSPATISSELSSWASSRTTTPSPSGVVAALKNSIPDECREYFTDEILESVQKNDITKLVTSKQNFASFPNLLNVAIRLECYVERLNAVERWMGSDSDYLAICLRCVSDCVNLLSTLSDSTTFASSFLSKQLHSAQFNYLCKSCDWDLAYTASLLNPDQDRKVEQAARLAVKMVEAGELEKLCSLPMGIVSSGDSNSSSSAVEVFEVIVRGLVEANLLEEAAAVCASRGEWRRAAALAPDSVSKYTLLNMVSKESQQFLSMSNPVDHSKRTFLSKQDVKFNGALELAKKALDLPSDQELLSADDVFSMLCALGMIDSALDFCEAAYSHNEILFSDKIKYLVAALCDFCVGDSFGIDRVEPGLLDGSRKYGRVMSSRADKRKAAWGRLEETVKRFGSSQNGLALFVASELLRIEEGRGDLPLWLTTMLGGGGSANSLFATLSPGEGDSDENAPGLLRLYMEWGLYVEALVLVRDCLSSGQDFEARKNKALTTPPEKGGVDFVPYNTIDVLFELVDETLGGGLGGADLSQESAETLQKARDDAEAAIRQHFKVLKLGEEALSSARALSRVN